MKDCCGIPFKPTWEEVPPDSGEWIFQSTCPTCRKVTECQPGGYDMQQLHRILARRGKLRSPEPEPTAQQEVSENDLQVARDSALALRILSDLRAWQSRADRTPQQIEAKIHECINRCQTEMKHQGTIDKAVEGFGMMLGRIQEFTSEDPEA